MTQFLRDQASDSEEVVTPLMLDGTYLSRNFATLGPLPDSRRVLLQSRSLSWIGYGVEELKKPEVSRDYIIEGMDEKRLQR